MKRCLLPKIKGITNIEVRPISIKNLLQGVAKVGIVSIIKLNTIWELCYPTWKSGSLTPLGGPKVCYTDLTFSIDL